MDTPPASEAQQDARAHALLPHVATLLPVSIALGLGAVYATGVVVYAGQFSDAGYDVSQTLALIPLEELLSRGLATLFTPAVTFSLLASVLIVWSVERAMSGSSRVTAMRRQMEQRIFAARASRVLDAVEEEGRLSGAELRDIRSTVAQGEAQAKAVKSYRDGFELDRSSKRAVTKILASADSPEPSVRTLKGLRVAWTIRGFFSPFGKGLPATCCAFLLFSVLVAKVDALPVVAVVGLDLAYMLSVVRSDQPFRRWAAILVGASVPLALALSTAYLRPAPLPSVHLRVKSALPLEGDLIASPGTSPGTWYVGGVDHSLRAIPSTEVIQSTISRTPHRPESPNVFNELRDWLGL